MRCIKEMSFRLNACFNLPEEKTSEMVGKQEENFVQRKRLKQTERMGREK